MKLYNINEVNEFLNTIDECKGDVILKSNEGDVFNLKSKLTQSVAVGKLISTEGENLELFCMNKEDEANFFKFFREHPNTNK